MAFYFNFVFFSLRYWPPPSSPDLHIAKIYSISITTQRIWLVSEIPTPSLSSSKCMQSSLSLLLLLQQRRLLHTSMGKHYVVKSLKSGKTSPWPSRPHRRQQSLQAQSRHVQQQQSPQIAATLALRSSKASHPWLWASQPQQVLFLAIWQQQPPRSLIPA